MAFLSLLLLLLSTVCSIKTASLSSGEEDAVSVELEMISYDLEDQCEILSKYTENYFLNKLNGLKEKISSEQEYGKFLRLSANHMKQSFEDNDIPYNLKRNWTLITQCGDGLLPEDDWNEKISFYNTIFETKYSNFSDYKNVLAISKNESVLRNSWLTMQNGIPSSSKEQFPSILKKINTAAEINNKYDAKTYWEALNDYEDSYSKAITLWEEIRPLYEKLHKFVKIRINRYYNKTDNVSNMPVYLLGSNYGTEWYKIADIILPHPQSFHTIKEKLQHMSVEEIYGLAENMTKTLNMGGLGKEFWLNSQFNMTSCKSHILNHCSNKYSRLLTCNETTFSTYLEAHGNAMKITINNQDYENLMIQNLRYSALDEAIIGMGKILSIDNLYHYGLLKKNHNNDNNYNERMTLLLLKALIVLPQLPYYLVADTWRLNELENPSANIAKSWWEMRKQYQGVEGVDNTEFDFLQDEYMLLNKPYISKFLGIFLQFQIIEYHTNRMNDDDDILNVIADDPTFTSTLEERNAREWPYTVNYQYGIYEVSSSSILDYFRALEEYLDSAPIEQEPIKTTTTQPKNPKIQQNKPNIRKINETFAQKNHTEDSFDSDEKNNKPQNTAMYAAVSCLAVVIILLIGFTIYKKVFKRNNKSNNRRFN